ncbi:OprO/OprP family phosphate-selective porin [Allopontixanthobacter sp.]|uniref:OprO/OprP family phosphate-selective porin n=1 Tax=Allopontixanthobacter sp. TaxID=2906452 RepID=UPI002ABCA7A3|nr:porin [Allopontixanthobacter sp.]MDZ4306636.1 porin [Allopontixanthobacter sp.]
MAIHRTLSTLALATALGWTIPAHAQSEQSQTGDLQAEIAAMREQMAAMAQQIEALEARLEASQSIAAAAAPRNAAPVAQAPAAAGTQVARLETQGGWSFQPFGRLMFDAGSVNAPASIADPGLGFGNEVRRARFGVQGDIPGGFNYKMELEFTGGEVEITDAILGYDAGDTTLTVGQHNNFQGLEELTSSRFTSFMERAAFTDAFDFQRRVGLSASYGKGNLLFQGGVFTDNIDNLDASNNSWGADARAVVAPKLGDLQLHAGASVHYRDLNDAQADVRYRQRPQVHFTDTRFVNTGNIGADSELGYGLELAAIKGPLHVTGETFWQQVDRPGALADPTFFGGYAEVGYFLTPGDSRGYKGNKFDRVKPKNPVGKGGFGAVQVNARYDHLDLSDAAIIGGTQDSYGLSVIWTPTDYTRFMLNYWRNQYRDAAIAAGTSTDYSVDSFGVRAQVDF